MLVGNKVGADGDRKGTDGFTGSTKQVAGHRQNGVPIGYKPKDLLGIPWALATALRSDGWYLRSDIIWHKPNAMPGSQKDRPTNAHEHIFLLSKNQQYYYDHESVKSPSKEVSIKRRERAELRTKSGYEDAHFGNPPMRRSDKQRGHSRRHDGFNDRGYQLTKAEQQSQGATLRDVWTVATKPYRGPHFAVYPTTLIEPCIKAGCPGPGKRCDCDELILTPTGDGSSEDPTIFTGRAGMNRSRRLNEGTRPITRREQREYAVQMRESPYRDKMARVAGKAFDHYIRTDQSGARPLPQHLLDKWLALGWLHKPTPCSCPIGGAGTVLDPFFGAGTTGLVAHTLGRNFIGIELSQPYMAQSYKRLRKAGAQVTLV